MKKIDLLRALQEVDSALDQVRHELEECRGRLGDDSELVPLREKAEAIHRELHVLQDKGKDLDYKIEDIRARVKKEEKKLYDGSVKNPKELGQLSHDVDLEKEKISKLEDQALSNMDAVEVASAADADAARDLSAREQSWRAEQDALQSRCGDLTAQDADLVAKRTEAAAAVDAATLKSYDTVRRMRGGVAVAPVERGACKGCRISLSSSVIQRARASADLVPCQNCGRFLYVP